MKRTGVTGQGQPASDDIDEAAARWCDALNEAGDDRVTQRAFDAWRAAAPGHATAFRRAQSAHALVRSFADAPELQALRRDTLARTARPRPRCVLCRRVFAVAASLFVVAALGVALVDRDAPGRIYDGARGLVAGNVYETAVGQRSVVTLDDGSIITLNTDSRVSVHYVQARRAVRLERGQALFKVAKDRARPFVVSAAGREVTALGTEFDVRMSPRLFEVTLLEGRITVAPERTRGTSNAPTSVAELRPGQQFIARAATPPQVRAADVRREVSWRHGQVVFEDERLDDAVAEMNRYSRRQVVLGDAGLGALKISGAFNTGDTGTFVDALTDYFPIQRAAPDRDAIVLTQRPTKRG